jgi:hypothetical protein
MPLPTKVKTWQYNVNSAQGNSGTRATDLQQVMYFYKTAVTTFATLPWTCSGSCNSAASSMDGTDRWTSSATLVWGLPTVAHSWIVLRQTGIATKYEVCIDLAYSDKERCAVVVSTVGFGTANGGTDGSTTARPTATDEYAVLTTANYWTDNYTSGTQGYKCHCLQSDDGQCTRFYACNTYQGCVATVFSFEKPISPISSWTNPWFSVSYGSANRALSALRTVIVNDTAVVKFRQSNLNSSAYLATLFYIAGAAGEQAAGQVPNDVSGEWPFYGIKIYSESTGARGKVGGVYDMYYGPTTLTNGDQFDAAGSCEWAFLNDLIIPWNGTVIQTT